MLPKLRQAGDTLANPWGNRSRKERLNSSSHHRKQGVTKSRHFPQAADGNDLLCCEVARSYLDGGVKMAAAFILAWLIQMFLLADDEPALELKPGDMAALIDMVTSPKEVRVWTSEKSLRDWCQFVVQN